MKNIDLSLNGILDSRWKLELIGNGKIKLNYNSVKGIPSVKETKEAIRQVLEAKKINSLYISGRNGDVLIENEDILNENKNEYAFGMDIFAEPDGAELGLLKRELEEMEK